jgi:hypothetical protein
LLLVKEVTSRQLSLERVKERRIKELKRMIQGCSAEAFVEVERSQTMGS